VDCPCREDKIDPWMVKGFVLSVLGAKAQAEIAPEKKSSSSVSNSSKLYL